MRDRRFYLWARLNVKWAEQSSLSKVWWAMMFVTVLLGIPGLFVPSLAAYFVVYAIFIMAPFDAICLTYWIARAIIKSQPR